MKKTKKQKQQKKKQQKSKQTNKQKKKRCTVWENRCLETDKSNTKITP